MSNHSALDIRNNVILSLSAILIFAAFTQAGYVNATASTPPQIAILTQNNQVITVTNQIVISGTSLSYGGNNPIKSVTYKIDNGPVSNAIDKNTLVHSTGPTLGLQPAFRNWYFDSPILSNGKHVITVTATDSHGASVSASISVTINYVIHNPSTNLVKKDSTSKPTVTIIKKPIPLPATNTPQEKQSSTQQPAKSSSTQSTSASYTHNDGLGQTFTSSYPVGTYTQITAQQAASAWGKGMPTMTTCSGSNAVVVQTTNSAAVWAYTGSAAGHVHLSSNSIALCPNSSDPTWN